MSTQSVTQVQNRYFFSPTHAKSTDKGVKKAGLFERITFRATTIIVDGQKMHVNSRSLKNYFARKMSPSDSPKVSQVVKGFFHATSMNTECNRKLSKEDQYAMRGLTLTGLERTQTSLKEIKTSDDATTVFSTAAKAQQTFLRNKNIFGFPAGQNRAGSSQPAKAPLRGRVQPRPRSWAGETKALLAQRALPRLSLSTPSSPETGRPTSFNFGGKVIEIVSSR